MKTLRWCGVLVCLALWPGAAARAGGWYLLEPPPDDAWPGVNLKAPLRE